MLVHASLFSGIGGFDLAADWMGWDNLFHCEWNLFGQKVLKHHFPKSISYNDITKTDFSIHRGQVDILTGGFPFQPYSLAGKRLGKEDERHLFPEMLRTIQEVQPRWIVAENVLGIVNWGGGVVFEEVQTFMEAEGYEVQAYVLPAAGKSAPHKRDRVWFIAYSERYSNKYSNNGGSQQKEENLRRENEGYVSNALFNNGDASYSNTSRVHEQHFATEPNKSNQFSRFSFERRDFSRFPTKSAICGRDDGIPRELDSITFSKWRNESIKAYGNAIVPQVAYEIFKAIEEFELMVNK